MLNWSNSLHGWFSQCSAALLRLLSLAFFLGGVVGAGDLQTIATSAVADATSFGDTFKTLIAVMVVLSLAGLGFWFVVATIRNRPD
jgi:Flp pilus assembly protein protease CpaA